MELTEDICLGCLIFLEKVFINGRINNEKNELERIMDEKIYEITNKIFMYFQIKGCSIQMSNGCNPYSIIIVDDVKIG
ncbi:MAG: hypothetical protein U0M05_04955 [Clostridia bacterium]|nr:hypothetical protein [Clostridia bacterium]MDO4382687.1 hypothetical protein [Clostridia bacterium]MEE0790627.1 hypothetical protein [Clostridia bacterium]OLA93067.1 MAG: hypothetical protein BHW63_03040 [Mycoplasma sp. CAG:611_25_7]HJJ09867.1 hypothetical protein [Clostridiaceae bacterium]